MAEVLGRGGNFFGPTLLPNLRSPLSRNPGVRTQSHRRPLPRRTGGLIVQPLSPGVRVLTASGGGRGLLLPVDRYEEDPGSRRYGEPARGSWPPATDRPTGYPNRPHIRKSFRVKGLAGASSVVCPCIAVMGWIPAACDRVGETTGGAAHDVSRGTGWSSMPRRARPGRLLDPP